LVIIQILNFGDKAASSVSLDGSRNVRAGRDKGIREILVLYTIVDVVLLPLWISGSVFSSSFSIQLEVFDYSFPINRAHHVMSIPGRVKDELLIEI